MLDEFMYSSSSPTLLWGGQFTDQMDWLYSYFVAARESDYTLRFPGFSNNSAYVKYNYDYVYVITSLSACAWFKTTAAANEMTLLSYATSQHLSAIQWSIINGTTILMNINSWNPR